MAVTKILAKHMRLDHLIRYVCNPKKTEEQVFVSAVGCQPRVMVWTLSLFLMIVSVARSK